MAQKVLVEHDCDVCTSEGRQTEVTYSEVITFGSITRLLELCEEHEQQLIGDLPEILKEVGQRYNGKRPPKPPQHINLDEGYPCNEKNCGRKFSTPQGLASHLRLAHGVRKGQREPARKA